MDTNDIFLEILDEVLFEDCESTVWAKLVYTESIRDRYVQRGLIDRFPSQKALHKLMGSLGYINLGLCATKGSRGRGTFWTQYPDLFLTGGVTDRKAVSRCVYRRSLYLKVKQLLPKKAVFTMGEAAEFFGKSQNTIRAWDRAGILPARRTEGGHRRYDLSRLLLYP